MKILRLLVKVFIGKFLTDTLLLGFSFGWLIFIVIPLLLAKQHVYGAWYDYNLPVLIIEALVCVFASIWAVIRIMATIKRERRLC